MRQCCMHVLTTAAGKHPEYPTYVAIKVDRYPFRCMNEYEMTDDGYKGTVFDVTGNKAYGPEGSYKGMLVNTCTVLTYEAYGSG